MDPEQRREQLLDAVLRIIVTQGVHKVSIDAVAREAAVSRPVVYRLFDDSDHLLRASLDREEAAGLAQMAEVVPRPGTGDPAQAASDGLGRFLAAVQSAPDRWRAAFALVDSSTPTFRRRIETGRQAFIAALTTFVRTATPPGRLDAIDIELTARALYALYWDSGRLILTEPDTFSTERVIRFADNIIRALPAFHDHTEQDS
ncbi:TetR/AcrR family transcriptional regulator [Nocardia terpenica]|uniref:HTH tetR-type domain-containing protein n=1 Tax=Nocardia terpenica TaxID=455432 RepID=A0A164H4S1_9NOCA|nr:TetR/AcrR family transcriptional regulator [Nocardia terpenica]KZM68199.1 hypothetical protein AWN90_09730 [Nocardia terpenica]NQE88926.1 TetR/AcrR family transcriptional regulator [Nocardia terpenica]